MMVFNESGILNVSLPIVRVINNHVYKCGIMEMEHGIVCVL
jgi:hypothetical protein